jgi:hypothetical protein
LPRLWDVHSPERLWPIGLGLDLCGEIVEEGSYLLCAPVLDRGDGHAVDAGGTLVGGNVDPRPPHHVTAGELVVESMEATLRVLLGAAVKHALERLEDLHVLSPTDGPRPKSGTVVLRTLGCVRLI